MTLRWTGAEQLSDDWRSGLFGPGAIFELVEESVLGVRLPVFAQRPRTLTEVLRRAADKHGERAFLLGDTRTVTFAEAPTVVARWAAWLREHHGLRSGDRVALAGAVSVEHALALWAVAEMGGVSATLNPAWTADELAHAIALVEPGLVIVDDDVVPRLPTGIEATTFAEAAAASAVRAPVRAADVSEDDPFAIVFTSGTTGRPKGATLTHRNAVQFSLSAAATAAVNTIVHGVHSSGGQVPTVLASAPLFHVSGLLGQLTNAAFWGVSLVMPAPGRWQAETHLDLTQQHRVTTWSLVPTQLWRIIDHPELDRWDLSSLEIIGGGGATFPPELLRRTTERLPHVSTALRVGYGMTETAGTVTLLQPPYDEHVRASVGQPVAGTEVQIRGADGAEVPDGEVGEIWARSAQVFLGYWNDPAATAAVLDHDRWYATGDFGRIDRGYVFLESRLRDLIIRGGENIAPIEIENRLVEHPDIADAAVVGVPHDTLGQEVRAVVVRRPGTTLDADEVRAWVGLTLARYKVPASVVFVDELPRNETGKVLKDRLAELG